MSKDFNGIAYHQSNVRIAKFNTSKSATGSIWLTTNLMNFKDPSSAASASAGKGIIHEVQVQLKKVGSWKEEDKYVTDQLIQMGYDGMIFGDDIQVFDTSTIQIKRLV